MPTTGPRRAVWLTSRLVKHAMLQLTCTASICSNWAFFDVCVGFLFVFFGRHDVACNGP